VRAHDARGRHLSSRRQARRGALAHSGCKIEKRSASKGGPMRRLLIVVVLACLVGIAGADEIWLKDGRRIVTKKPFVQKGSLALLTTTDGVLLSIPLSEVDFGKTAAEKARAAAATPVPTARVL